MFTATGHEADDESPRVQQITGLVGTRFGGVEGVWAIHRFERKNPEFFARRGGSFLGNPAAPVQRARRGKIYLRKCKIIRN